MPKFPRLWRSLGASPSPCAPAFVPKPVFSSGLDGGIMDGRVGTVGSVIILVEFLISGRWGKSLLVRAAL